MSSRTTSLVPDRWNGHVAKAIRLLERTEHAEHARFGYCRGAEVADFVAAVDARSRAR